MLEEDDTKIRFIFSYVGNEEIFLKVAQERFVSEENFSSLKELKNFREEVKPWIDAGMIGKRWDSFEERFHYFLAKEGEEYYRSLKPSHKER